MFKCIQTGQVKKLLAKSLIAGSVFLCALGNAFADANLETSSAFVSADGARGNIYMDSGGTWDGAGEITNTFGDTFGITVNNTATGLDIDDSAFDLAIGVNVASGFRLPATPAAVTVSAPPFSCPPISGVTATQAGGPGSTISFVFPPDTDIQPGCGYNFSFGLTTDDVAPFVADGIYDVDFSVAHYVDDDDSNTEITQTQTESIEVRTGEVALLKTAETTNAGDGDTVEFTVSILNAGDGGIFNVDLTDTLSPDLVNLRIVPLGSPPTATSLGNPLTIPYIQQSSFAEYTVYADVAVNPAASTCPDLTNSADVIDRTMSTSSFFDSVPFDLDNPLLDYTPPDITIPFGVAGIDVTIPVTNIGAGVAKNISIRADNLAVFTIVIDNAASPNWTYAGAGVFSYTGTIAAGVTENIVFNVSINTCPPPASQDLDWIPAYQNVCGTDFFPPLRFSTMAVGNAPDLTIEKTTSASALNIGQAGNYLLTLSGTNVASLPDDGVATNLDFSITDTLPVGITSATINTIPATTEVLVNGLAYTAGSPIPDNADIIWRGDYDDLTPLPTLRIDYIAGSSTICPVGQTITNTAIIDYAGCAINNEDSAGFILNESPVGGVVSNILLGGDGNFETGAADIDGVARNQFREGELIPFNVSYSFPAGFNGTWSGSSFNAELRSDEASGVPLVLSNSRTDVRLQITRISDSALICDLDLNPATDFTGGDGVAALNIPDLNAIVGCVLPTDMQDHAMELTYSVTSPEGNLVSNNPSNDNNVGSYLENTRLTVSGGDLSCLGTSDFLQAVNVNIERAALDLSATINNGNPVSVCSVVPASLNISGPAVDTTSDNILLQFNDANFEFVDAAGNPGNETTDIAYAGSMATLAMSGSRIADDVFMTPALNTSTVTADGTVNFNVRLRNSALPQTLSAQLDYDSRHTSPNGSIGDVDRDYSIPIVATPFEVLSGQLVMEFFPPDIILLDSVDYSFRMQIANVGTGDAVNAEYRITLPTGMRFEGADVAPITTGAFDFSGQTIEWSLADMAPGEVINININTRIDQTSCFGSDVITSENEWGCGSPIINTANDPPLILAPAQLTLMHDGNNSFCELCSQGEIRLRVTNTGSLLLTNVKVIEDLLASGLTYVDDSTSYRVDGVAVGVKGDPALNPTLTGTNVLTWTPAEIPELASLYSAFSTDVDTPQEIEIVFNVERAVGFTQEGLISADRNIEARATFGLFCDQFAATPVVRNASSGLFELPLEQPAPQITLQGRNVDANQSAAQYRDDVFGGAQDDVIWRLTVANDSADARADLEDLLVNNLYSFISKTISPSADNMPNFNIIEICNSEANASLSAAGTSPGLPACIAPPGSATATSHDVDDPFGNPPDDEALAVAEFIDTLENGQAELFFVGKFQTLCNLTSANADIEWGCELDGGAGTSPGGGITDGIGNVPASVVVTDTQISGTDVDAGDIAVSHEITGSNTSQPLGSKGILKITIANNANGSVRNLTLTDVLPTGYALDISQVVNPGTDDSLLAAVVTTARFGDYPGMVDTATVTNLDATDFENNTTLDIAFSSSPGAVAPQDNLLRAGDEVILTIRIIKISNFDLLANPDVEEEIAGTDDPLVITGLSNELSVNIRNTCDEVVGVVSPANLAVNPSPADLDITINSGDVNKTYVISDPTASLTLDVEVINRGGHDANNHFIVVTVGSGLLVDSGPTACSVYDDVSPLIPPRPLWAPVLPASGAIYICDAGVTIAPGGQRNYIFTVQKDGAGADLTFRADVVGEITLVNTGAGLDYPPVVAPNVANNYSLDSIRARIIGFNLTKRVTSCREQAAFAASLTAEAQIGEDCTYRLSAGWFGFTSPGFANISIGNVTITDDVTPGQGFISQSDAVTGAGAGSVTAAVFSSTPAAVAAPDEITQGNWDYNTNSIIIADDFNIDIDIVKRTRNVAANIHTLTTTDTLTASFDVDFDGAGGQPPVTFNRDTLNFPPEPDREVDIRVAEPNLVISKQVCNEEEAGNAPGVACLSFADNAEGDVNDIFTYRIQITNTAVVGALASKPAFDVEVIDTLDLYSEVLDPATDGIDNDGDSVTDEAGTGDGIRGGTAPVGVPARTMTFDATTTAALAQIDPGTTINLYYRVDADDMAVPGQVLNNSVTVTYDSLAGASGAQDVPLRVNGDPAGAREYSLTDTADINLLVPVASTDSKAITQTSLTVSGANSICTPETGNTYCTGIGAAPQNIQRASIGEEILFRMEAGLPAATYNNLIIRDTLPAGLDCTQVPPVNLSTDFSPNTEPTITCTDTEVTWDFGNRVVTALPLAPLVVTFVARVENLATLNADESDAITNGGLSTVAVLEFDDQGGSPQTVTLGPARLTIAEPLLTVNQSFAVATADAGDILTATVTITNAATTPTYNSAPAYNLQVLNDLQGTGLTFQNVTTSFAQQPNTVVTGGSGNEPLFSWNTGNAIFPIMPGDTVTFTYNVAVENTVQPLDSLSNTVDIRWTSLPSNNTLLNTVPTATDMREGSVPPAGLPADDYEASFTNNVISVPGATITKVDDNAAVPFTIGTSKRFRVTVQLPDGFIPAPGLNISDILDSTGTGYIYDDSSINYTINNIESINGTLGGDETNFTSLPANGPGPLNWVTGAIVTSINDDQVTVEKPEIIIEYNARVNNDITTGIEPSEIDSLTNIANLNFVTGTDGPVSAGTFNVLEPILTTSKTFSNVTPGKLPGDLPDGGDIIEVTISARNDGASTAFDVNIVDTLPPQLQRNATAPVILINGSTTGTVTPSGPSTGPLVWGRDNSDDTLDIPAGQILQLTYQLTLQDIVQPALLIDNSVFLDWTSLDGVSAVERTGAGCPLAIAAPNDYCREAVAAAPLTVANNNTITKTRLSDTSPVLNAANDVRIGDIVDYELRLRLIEGSNPNIVLTDTLPQGLVFEEVISVNTDLAADYSSVAPFSYPVSIPATNIVAAGDATAGATTVTWTLGEIINAADNTAANDEFVITYRARVLNLVQMQTDDIDLTNTVEFDYDTATVAAATQTDTETVRIQQPELTVSKIAAPAGGDAIVDADEIIRYTVEILNEGTAPAYDLLLRDTIPVGMRNDATTVSNVQISLASGGPPLTSFLPDYNQATRVAEWDMDSGVNNAYTIPTGDTLVISYDVQVDADVGVGLVMVNSAQVQNYYSFDNDDVPVAGVATGVREIYGPSNIATTSVNTAAANPLTKANPANLNASIGQPFVYTITIPGTVQTNALHDVRILDDLTASAADMVFVSAVQTAGPAPFFTLTNTGSTNNLVIENVLPGTGIEVPAGEQIEVEITVQLRDQLVNTAVPPLLFNNTARYTTNMIDGDDTTRAVTIPVTTGDMTVVEPTDMTLVKTGPATMLFGTPGVFTLDVQNIGTGPAYDLTITDVLPNPTPGGMCDTPPDQFVAQIIPVAGPVRNLTNTDYVTSFAGDPVCTLTITMQSDAARLDANDRLVVTYEATLDINNFDGIALTNVASATEWFSADTAGAGATGEIRTYTRPITNGTVGTPDHQDAHTVLTESAILSFSKRVFNVTSATAPAVNAILPAEPGDTLEYTLTVTNTGNAGLSSFQIVDEPDRLTSPSGGFDNTSINVTSSPTGSTVSIVGGVLTVSNLNLGAAGAIDDSLTITFEIDFLSVLPSGTLASNQAVLEAANFTDLLSDDPNINGVDDPLVFGDEDETRTLIGSVPSFRVDKTSTDLTGDTSVLRAGDVLRYSIEVQNIGLENAKDTVFRDQIPANTSYVANSATLNGSPLTDAGSGISPFQNGVLINAPENTTAGIMRAEAGGSTNIAVITFDVIVSTNVVNGTVISNQGFVVSQGESSGAVPTTPSDNPDTSLPDDATQDVVGNFPILDAQKTVDFVPGISGDVNGDNIVNPGERLRYTIVVSNAGSVDASNVKFVDSLPSEVTYLDDTSFLNNEAIGQPDSGSFPFAVPAEISSDDLTLPLPAADSGTITAGESAVIRFDVEVNAGVANGTVIRNTGTITSAELPNEETDADGNEENGDQPTDITVGVNTGLSITKEVIIVGGGLAQAGGTLEYIINVVNTGSVNATNVVVTDVMPADTSYVAGSAQLNGLTLAGGATLVEPGVSLTADGGTLEPDDNLTLSFRVITNSSISSGTSITNTAAVDWTENGGLPVTDSASVDIGGAPGVAVITGQVWRDTNFDNTIASAVIGTSDPLLANWRVDILVNGNVLDTVDTDAAGAFTAIGLTPGGGNAYSLIYHAPGSGATSALLGRTSSIFTDTNALQQIDDINLNAGAIVPGLNLPITPNGIVYDSVLRTEVEGAMLTMINKTRSNQMVPPGCYDDPNHATQVTLAQGFYKFDLNFSDAARCATSDEYEIQVTPPANGYVGTTSVIIPPVDAGTGNPLDVPACPGTAADQIPSSMQYCEVSANEMQPATSVEPRSTGTDYYLSFLFDNVPSTDQVFNNHIPVDPKLDAAIAISKVAGLLNVTRSQLVPYTITLTNSIGVTLQNLNIVDDFPAGFKYVKDSARIDGVAVEPVVNGQQMVWQDLTVNTSDSVVIKMLLIVSSGVGEGEYVNTARVINSFTGEATSGVASATVRVIPDPTFDCTDIIGKVYDDKNMNAYQDEGERGLAGVQVATARGLRVSTDEHGRFHITCAVVPSELRGSNFIMKLDDRTLPSGYRMTTENPRVQRATRGKMLKFNFGAAIHRIVRLDLANGVFEKDSTELRPQWRSRIDMLIIELQKDPSILRLSYLGENETESEVADRLSAIEDLISERWEQLNCCYKLTIETEVFWRKGNPSDRKTFD